MKSSINDGTKMLYIIAKAVSRRPTCIWRPGLTNVSLLCLYTLVVGYVLHRHFNIPLKTSDVSIRMASTKKLHNVGTKHNQIITCVHLSTLWLSTDKILVFVLWHWRVNDRVPGVYRVVWNRVSFFVIITHECAARVCYYHQKAAQDSISHGKHLERGC